MKSYIRVANFLCLLACAEAGFWGSSGFLSASKVEEKLIEADSMDRIAEQAEAEAWNSFEKSRIAEKIAKTMPKKNSTAPKEVSGLSPSQQMASVLSAHAGEEVSATTVAAAAVKAAERPARKPRNREVMLIKNMKSTGAEGEDAVACVTHCRYGKKVRQTWDKCIGRCIEHSIFYDTFMKMLPAEFHAAKSLDEAIPEGLELPTEEQMKRINHAVHKRQHASEL